jgi:hypothetical protein
MHGLLPGQVARLPHLGNLNLTLIRAPAPVIHVPRHHSEHSMSPCMKTLITLSSGGAGCADALSESKPLAKAENVAV